jgi:hypothetical protein
VCAEPSCIISAKEKVRLRAYKRKEQQRLKPDFSLLNLSKKACEIFLSWAFFIRLQAIFYTSFAAENTLNSSMFYKSDKSKKMSHRNNVFALVPLATMMVVLSGLLMINSCEKNESETKILEPITLIQPDSVVAPIKRNEPLPLEIKFVTDRPILYAIGLYSIDSANINRFDPGASDTIFRIYDSIPKENKKFYKGEFKIGSNQTRPGHKIRVKIAMQALGNSGAPEPTHYFEKYLRWDVVK